MEPPISNGEQLAKSKSPFVTAETKDRLLTELGIKQETEEPQALDSRDVIVNRILDSMEGKQMKSSSEFYRGMFDFAKETFMEVADVNPELVKTIQGVIKEKDVSGLYSDQYAAGMALVLKAMHYQSDYKLIYKLSELEPQDLETIRTAIVNGFPSKTRDIFEYALTAPRIPVTQENLRELVNAPGEKNPSFRTEFKLGAALMYDALDKVWENLSINQTSTVDSAPPNPPTQPF